MDGRNSLTFAQKAVAEPSAARRFKPTWQLQESEMRNQFSLHAHAANTAAASVFVCVSGSLWLCSYLTGAVGAKLSAHSRCCRPNQPCLRRPRHGKGPHHRRRPGPGRCAGAAFPCCLVSGGWGLAHGGKQGGCRAGRWRVWRRRGCACAAARRVAGAAPAFANALRAHPATLSHCRCACLTARRRMRPPWPRWSTR